MSGFRYRPGGGPWFTAEYPSTERDYVICDEHLRDLQDSHARRKAFVDSTMWQTCIRFFSNEPMDGEWRMKPVDFWKNFKLGEELSVSGTFLYNGVRRFQELKK